MDFCEFIEKPKLDNVTLHSQLREPMCGSLCLTFSHIIFSNRKDDEFELWVNIFFLIAKLFRLEMSSPDDCPTDPASKYWYGGAKAIPADGCARQKWVNLQTILKVCHCHCSLPSTGHQLILKCKDLKILQLEIPNGQDFVSVASSIEKLSGIRDIEHHYGFYYRPLYHLLVINLILEWFLITIWFISFGY